MNVRFHWLLTTAALALGTPGCDSGSDDGNADSMADAGSDESSGGSGSRACVGETRDDFAIGVSRAGMRVEVSIMDAVPSDPIRGDNGWTFHVMDAGTALEGATLSIQPWMPDHGHGTPVEPVITDMGEGDYEIAPLNLFMAGLWEITLEIELADGTVDEVMFAACVE